MHKTTSISKSIIDVPNEAKYEKPTKEEMERGVKFHMMEVLNL